MQAVICPFDLLRLIHTNSEVIVMLQSLDLHHTSYNLISAVSSNMTGLTALAANSLVRTVLSNMTGLTTVTAERRIRTIVSKVTRLTTVAADSLSLTIASKVTRLVTLVTNTNENTLKSYQNTSLLGLKLERVFLMIMRKQSPKPHSAVSSLVTGLVANVAGHGAFTS